MLLENNPAPGFERFPDHQLDVSLFKGEVSVHFDGEEIARTREAVRVEETGHSPVYYLPFNHISQDHLRESDHITRCPFKGKARYWNLRVGDHEIDNAAWAYEMPYDEVLELAGMVAFFESKVKISTQPAT